MAANLGIGEISRRSRFRELAGKAFGSRMVHMGSINIQNILRIEVPLQVLLAQKNMNVDEILSLAPGSVITFTKNYEAPLHLLANGKPIGSGVAVKVGEKFGMQVREMGRMSETILALRD